MIEFQDEDERKFFEKAVIAQLRGNQMAGPMVWEIAEKAAWLVIERRERSKKLSRPEGGVSGSGSGDTSDKEAFCQCLVCQKVRADTGD